MGFSSAKSWAASLSSCRRPFFPSAGICLQNGASYGAIAGFVFTAILIGITTLPLEIKLLGVRFTAARNIFTFVIAFFISLLMEAILA
ncbi:MAG: hypothetical protein MZV70_74895 [Desulfobacterales bacterium]|nr:hypothetical protein [Desulfobacterales bacterium]